MFVLVSLPIIVCSISVVIRTKAQTVLRADMGVDSLRGLDPIGLAVDYIDRILTQTTSANLRRSDNACATHVIKLAGMEVTVGAQPRGICSYCCPVINPKKYVKLFFTNKNIGEDMVELSRTNEVGSLQKAGFKSNISTVIYIHGFTEHGRGPMARKIRDAYLTRPENYNIITVDWGELSALPWYPAAVQNTRIVAKLLSDFIVFYHDSKELSISQLHLIGFSLGAHIAGFTGKFLKIKQKAPRITALDPARPSFPIEDPHQRLSRFDARYVDVIHTDGGKFGITVSLGHADFFPNGGVYIQPGCAPSSLADHGTIELFGSCSHIRAVELYSESVKNPKAFPVFKCASNSGAKRCKRSKLAYMGFSANRQNAYGDFYLVTEPKSPFGKSA